MISAEAKLTTRAASLHQAQLQAWGENGPDTNLSSNLAIEFARARLKHVDSFLNRQLQTIRDCARDSDAINKILTACAQYASGSMDNNNGKKAIEAACKSAVADLPDGPLKDKINSYLSDPNSTLNVGDECMTADEIGSIKTDFEGTLKSVDKRSQEDQLVMNAKMGERNEILQMAASLVQQLNEITKAILGRG
jgi:hypothetical protein